MSLRINVPPMVAMGLRGLEIAGAVVVAGIVGYYIRPTLTTRSLPLNRFVFTEVWAIVSFLVALAWLVPQVTRNIPPWGDFILSVGWWTAFALIVQVLNCGKFFSTELGPDGFCQNWKVVEIFCFVSAIAWIVTGLFGIQFVQQRRRGRGGGNGYY